MPKFEFEGDEDFVGRMEDMMTDAMMECGRVHFGRLCEREEEDYCKFKCPFREE